MGLNWRARYRMNCQRKRRFYEKIVRKLMKSGPFRQEWAWRAGVAQFRQQEHFMREQFTTVMKAAMKAGDKRRLATVRMMMAALKDKDIEARGLGKTVSDEDILALLQKMVKSRQESADIYAKAGRPELETQEREEIAIIGEFLPKQMSDDEVKAAITAAIAETGASSMKDMGKVVGVLRAKYAGQIDFGKASGLVKGMLGG
jgi:uncharacterized protein YqeY